MAVLATFNATVPSFAQIDSISITTSSLPSAYVGSSYGYAPGGFQSPPRLAANVAIPGAVWSVQGNFPPGLILASAGNFSGRPDREGVYIFTVTLQTPLGSATRSLSITVQPPPPFPHFPVPIGTPFRYKPACPIQAGSISYSVAAPPPSDVSFFSATGEFTGSFASRDPYRTLWRCKSETLEFTGDVTFVVVPEGRRFVPPAFVGFPYQLALDLSAGVPPIQAALATGSLPPGLALDGATRLIGGVPTSTGAFRFQVRYTDAAGNSSGEQLEIVVRRASLSASPRTLYFAANAGGSPTAPLPLTITGSVGQPYNLTSSAPWLAISRSAGFLPETLSVRVDPSTLQPGTHTAAITVTSLLLPSVSVAVSLELAPALPPKLSAEPARMLLAFARGERAGTRILTIRNQGGGVVPVTASVPADAREWVTVTPGEGILTPAAPFPLAVTVNPGNLPAGLYQTVIRVSGGGVEVSVPLFATIERSDRRLSLSDEGLFFRAKGARVFPESDEIQVIARGANPLNWTARAQTTGSGQWLRIRPSSGTSTPGERAPSIEVALDPSGLEPGLHFARIEVRASTDELPAGFATVVLRVLPPAVPQAPVSDRAGLLFIAGKATSASVRIFNPSDVPIDVSALADLPPRANWLEIDGLGTIPPGESRALTANVDAGVLPPGIYSGDLILAFGEGNKLVRIAVALIVPRTANASAGLRSASGCEPSRLKALFTRLGSDFASPVGLPIPVAVTVSDDCGDLVSTGSVHLTFSNGDPVLPLQPASDGRWTGTWVPRGSVSRVTVTANINSPGPPALKGSEDLSGTLESNSNTPRLSGVVSAVSFAASDPLAPGAFLSVIGIGLADGISIANQLPLPVDLGGTRLFLDGREVPLLFVSDQQINAVIPFDVASDTTHQVFVMRNGALSGNERVPLAPAQPAIFSKEGNGKGQGLILAVTPESYAIAEPATPARPGQALVIYCTGLGLTDPGVNAGQAAPEAPLAEAKATVSVTVGGRPAEVLFAGLAPGYTSLFQVNVILPDNVEDGVEVPVILTAGGRSSPAVTIAVQR